MENLEKALGLEQTRWLEYLRYKPPPTTPPAIYKK